MCVLRRRVEDTQRETEKGWGEDGERLVCFMHGGAASLNRVVERHEWWSNIEWNY